jgi:epoxyqueuosine reductase
MEGSAKMESMELLIQRKALELGYEKCGIVPLHMVDGFQEKLAERIQKIPTSSPFYQGQQRLAQVSENFPWAKSVVILTVPYSRYRVPEQVTGHIAKSYLFDTRIDEHTGEHQHSLALEAYLQSLGLQVAINRKFGVVAMRWAALQAGLGIVRRNNFFYTQSGSWIHLEAFLIDRELELKETTNLPSCPKNCNRCIKACPTGSLCDPYTMNPLQCISFLTTFGGRNLTQEPLANNFGEWVYGCDVCQDVCPMNHGKWIGNEEFPGIAELAPSLTVEAIMKMDEEYYRREVQPKFFYLTPDDLWKWQVNALNYIRNHYEEKYDQVIQDALKSPFPRVRELAESYGW